MIMVYVVVGMENKIMSDLQLKELERKILLKTLKAALYIDYKIQTKINIRNLIDSLKIDEKPLRKAKAKTK